MTIRSHASFKNSTVISPLASTLPARDDPNTRIKSDHRCSDSPARRRTPEPVPIPPAPDRDTGRERTSIPSQKSSVDPCAVSCALLRSALLRFRSIRLSCDSSCPGWEQKASVDKLRASPAPPSAENTVPVLKSDSATNSWVVSQLESFGFPSSGVCGIWIQQALASGVLRKRDCRTTFCRPCPSHLGGNFTKNDAGVAPMRPARPRGRERQRGGAADGAGGPQRSGQTGRLPSPALTPTCAPC